MDDVSVSEVHKTVYAPDREIVQHLPVCSRAPELICKVTDPPQPPDFQVKQENLYPESPVVFRFPRLPACA